MRTGLKTAAIAAFVLICVVLAFAASNSTTLQVNSTLQVNGTKLDPGQYKVTWTPNGDKADVVFKNGKNEVKVTAKVQDSKTVYSNTAVMRTSEGMMKELWIGGRTTTLIFAE
jgi:Protein of unknown function (DUF2911)